MTELKVPKGYVLVPAAGSTSVTGQTSAGSDPKTPRGTLVEAKSPSASRPVLGNGRMMRGKATRGRAGALPPKLNATVTARHVYRYVTTSGSVSTVNVDSLAHALGGIVVVDSTTMTPWASSSKIHSVTIWPAASTTAESNAGCQWAGGTGGQMKDEEIIETIPQGTTLPGSLRFVPPAKSLASDWIIHTQSANLMSIYAPAGSVVDLDVSFTLKNVFGADDQSVSAGILGSVDYGHLDSGQTILEPVGLPF